MVSHKTYTTGNAFSVFLVVLIVYYNYLEVNTDLHSLFFFVFPFHLQALNCASCKSTCQKMAMQILPPNSVASLLMGRQFIVCMFYSKLAKNIIGLCIRHAYHNCVPDINNHILATWYQFHVPVCPAQEKNVIMSSVTQL